MDKMRMESPDLTATNIAKTAVLFPNCITETVDADGKPKNGMDIFIEPTIKGKLGVNAMKAQRHLYDHIVFDSSNEKTLPRNWIHPGMWLSR